MAIDLSTARATVRREIRTNNSSFTDADIDDAIKRAGHYFLRLTKAELDRTDVTISSGVREIDLTTDITGFSADDYEYGEIDDYPVRLVPYQSIIRRFQGRTPKGRPDRIAFRPDDVGLLNKQTDQQYTFSVTHTAQFTSFTSGTGSNPVLNIPAEYAQDVFMFGAADALLMGTPGHPGSQRFGAEFRNVIRQAQLAYGRVSAGVQDTSVPATQQGRAALMRGDNDE